MTLDEVRMLLAKYEQENFHPPCIENEEDYDTAPRLEYRVTATGGALFMCGLAGGQSDIYVPVENEEQFRAILADEADVDWLTCNGADQPLRRRSTWRLT